MKLHLPKSLHVAVLSAIVVAGAQAGELKNIAAEGSTDAKWDIGVGVPDRSVLSDSYKITTNYVTIDSLTLDGSDTLGIYDTEGQLVHNVVNANGYLVAPGNGKTLSVFGSGVWNKGDDTYTENAPFTNTLIVNGKLHIKDNAQMALGGQYKRNSGYDMYMGVKADELVVDGTGEGVHLEATVGKFRLLTMNSGNVYIHHDTTYNSGTSSSSFQDPSDRYTTFKSPHITEKLTVNGGNLYIGRSESSTNIKDPGGSHIVNYFDGSIYQTNGNLVIMGKTMLSASVEQEGGSMSMAVGNLLRLNNSKGSSFIQKGSGTMSLGEMVYGSTGTGNAKLTLSQEGDGTISMRGARFKTNTSNVNTNASSITQNGAGTINMSGSYENVLFNINQNGKGAVLNLSLNTSTVMSGTPVNSASLAANNLTVNTHSTLNIKSGLLDVKNKLIFNIDTPDQTTAAIVMAGGDINVQNIANAVEFNLSDAVITDMMTDAMAYTRETGEELFTYTIDLVSGLNATDKGEFVALMDSGKLEWSLELPTVYGGPITMTELVDSGLQWSGDTLQIQTTWKSTPEPTTATLSILALAALATRRRRR